jgi:GDP-D-mannose 3',5'-epimerase
VNASIWRARGTTGWIMGIARKRLTIRHVSGPTGVPGRNSDKALIRTELGREPNMRLQQGLAKTYDWSQVRSAARAEPLA